jgi:hypothetical protein
MAIELISTKFIYDDDCCVAAAESDLVECESCRETVCLRCAVTLDGKKLHRECSASRRHDLRLLESFRSRNLAIKDSPISQVMELEVSEIGGYEQKPVCTIGISSELFLANLSMWSSGECECDAISADAGNQLFWKYRVLNTEGELESYLKDIYEVLSGLSSRAS